MSADIHRTERNNASMGRRIYIHYIAMRRLTKMIESVIMSVNMIFVRKNAFLLELLSFWAILSLYYELYELKII